MVAVRVPGRDKAAVLALVLVVAAVAALAGARLAGQGNRERA
jgi:hypothetical protein